MKRLCFVLAICGLGLSADARRATQHQDNDPASAAQRQSAAKRPETPQARTVSIGPMDLMPMHLRIGFSSMVVLPASDSILEVTCGDKEGWVINGAKNVVHVKPTLEGAKTNMNIITRSGR